MIKLKGIRKQYTIGSSDIEVLRTLDLEIEKGEFVSIMGPSGSGKSTLMNIIGCLDHPTEGTYTLNGISVESMGDDELARVRNRNIGFVFQSFNLLPRHSALENVELPLFYAGAKDAGPLARKALERVGLAHRVGHRPNELSGGERQRVAIARAIVTDPPIILGDVPAGNLDTRTGAEIMDFLKQLHEKGTTLIIVTHDPEIAGHSDRVINIRDGRIQGA
ncbi:MAG: macrolide ABC transporter ATP-binding protein [Deltaproteobacteria bacterium RBG_19FT_COMBO_58_16]|nr:MAG: macrolide ABC transporter ATP-binding protein [Deltaproteobacteria bacterium RBG_19FT_COMBO_58_16]